MFQKLKNEIKDSDIFKSILNHFPMGAVFCDIHENIISVNNFYAKIINHRCSKLIGKKLQFSHSISKAITQAISESKTVQISDFFFKAHNSNRFWYFNIFIGPILDDSKKTIGAYLFAKDVTRGVIAKARLKKANTNLLKEIEKKTAKINKKSNRIESMLEEKNIFLSNIAHELKTMLTIIQSSLELKKIIDQSEPKKILELEEDVYSEIKKMNLMIENMVFISKTNTNNYKIEETINIANLLKRVIRNLHVIAEEKSIKLTCNIDHNFSIKADEKQIESLFTNLIQNSIKYGKEKGTVKISAKKILNKIKIIFTDDGIGIAEEKIQDIFNPFFQVDKTNTGNERGFGLGLSICKKIVEAHNGTIFVKSTLGKGTKFEVSLPI